MSDAPTERRALLVNSTVAAVLGAGLMVLAHELSHLVAGLAMGIPGTLYSYGVAHEGSPVQNAIMAGAGPMFSLLTGLVMALWQPLRATRSFWHLLWLWFAYSSMMEGIGYLEITPFGAGDTAAVASHLGWPPAVGWVLLAGGIAGQFALAWGFAHPVGRMAGADRGAPLDATLWPWLLGTVVNLGLSGLSMATHRAALSPGEVTVILAAGSATLVFAPMAMIFQRKMNAQPYEPLKLKPIPVVGLALLAGLILLNQALNLGVQIG